MKTEGKILLRSSRILSFSPFLVMTVFAIGALFLDFLSCYKITAFAGPLADSNPMSKSVIKGLGCLNDNYETYGWMKIAPISVFVCQIIIPLLIIIKHFKKAFFLSSVSIIGIISTVGLSLFPFILPSSIDPKASLTIWDASSSEKTLLILLAVTIVCLPLIIFCTSFAYKVMRGGVNRASVNDNLNSY